MPKKDKFLFVKILLVTLICLALLLLILNWSKKPTLIEEMTGTNIEKREDSFSPLTPTPSLTAKPTPTVVDPKKAVSVQVTFYGWTDNDPPGKTIAYPKNRYSQALHQEAGGVGSLADPVTLAVKKDAWKVGTRFYLPYLKKYGIVEDLCANCEDNHLDVWMESNGNFPDQLLACENKWTKRREVVEIDPSANHSVDLRPFFDINEGSCR